MPDDRCRRTGGVDLPPIRQGSGLRMGGEGAIQGIHGAPTERDRVVRLGRGQERAGGGRFEVPTCT